jgi:hypothetical protein
MAVFSDVLAKGWFDDTRTNGKIWSIGGYVGGLHRWEEFENSWPMALANHNVPYFHMREMADPSGPFAKWHPPEEHGASLRPLTPRHSGGPIAQRQPGCRSRTR